MRHTKKKTKGNSYNSSNSLCFLISFSNYKAFSQNGLSTSLKTIPKEADKSSYRHLKAAAFIRPATLSCETSMTSLDKLLLETLQHIAAKTSSAKGAIRLFKLTIPIIESLF